MSLSYLDLGSGGHAWGVFVSGNYAYVADLENGFEIVDISNPQTALVVGSSNTPTDAVGAIAIGNYAYVADRSFGIFIFDVSNPYNPTLAASIPYNGNPRGGGGATDLALSGKYLFATGLNDNLLRIFDVSNPAAPLEVGRYASNAPYTVAVAGNYAYIGDYGGHVQEVTGLAKKRCDGGFQSVARALTVVIELRIKQRATPGYL